MFLFFIAEFELLMFHNITVKIFEKLNKRNLLKICPQVDIFLHNLHSFLLPEKVKKC